MDRPEFSPLPPDAPKEDRIGTALWSMSAAGAAGVVWFSVLLLVVSGLRSGSTAVTIDQIDPHALYVNVAAYGTMIGVFFIATCAWILLAPIPSLYRRGALSMVAALAGWCVAMAATFGARTAADPLGLVVLTVLAVIAAFALYRRAVASARS